jgi:hypothetical protein
LKPVLRPRLLSLLVSAVRDQLVSYITSSGTYYT